MPLARQWAMNAGVSDGTNPNGALSRQQLVTMLYRFAKSKGIVTGSGSKLNPKGIATRAHFAPSCLPLWGRWHGEAVTERV